MPVPPPDDQFFLIYTKKLFLLTVLATRPVIRFNLRLIFKQH